ncbi:hypothetical protein V6Z11_A10G144900 [Gossypium hirsutum]
MHGLTSPKNNYLPSSSDGKNYPQIVYKTTWVRASAMVQVQEVNVLGGGRGALVVACVEGLAPIAHQINTVFHPQRNSTGSSPRTTNQKKNPSEVSTQSSHSTIQDILHALIPKSLFVSPFLLIPWTSPKTLWNIRNILYSPELLQ